MKQSRFPLSVPMYAWIFKTRQRIMLRFFSTDKMTQGEGLYVFQV
jgi:hypothetical protein